MPILLFKGDNMILVILIVVVLASIAASIWAVLYRRFCIFNDIPSGAQYARLSWNTFRRIYESAPQKYTVDMDCGIYREILYDTWYTARVYVKFKTFGDFLAAKRYYKAERSRKLAEDGRQAEVSGTQTLIECVQKDIDNLVRDAARMLEEVKK